MTRPIHLEIRSQDPKQSQDFWSRVFGWSFVEQAGPVQYWGISTGPDESPGIHGGLMKSRDGQPMCVPWIEVEDIDATSESVVQCGGEVRVPKMPVPGVGELAYCAAADGIVFAIVKCSTTG